VPGKLIDSFYSVLCSVVIKVLAYHVGSSRALKKEAEALDYVCCVFPYTSFVLYCFLLALQWDSTQPMLNLFVKYNIVKNI